MRRVLLFVSLCLVVSSAGWADILKIDDRSDTLTAFLEVNDPHIGTISKPEVRGEVLLVTYTLPVGFLFAADYHVFRQLVNGPRTDDTSGTVSDMWVIVAHQSSNSAGICFA